MSTGLNFESHTTKTQVAEYLETLAAGFRDGELTMESGNDTVTLRVADDVSFTCSAKASPDKDKAAVEFSVKWHTSPDADRHAPSLHVLSGSQIHNKADHSEDFVDCQHVAEVAPARSDAAPEARRGMDARLPVLAPPSTAARGAKASDPRKHSRQLTTRTPSPRATKAGKKSRRVKAPRRTVAKAVSSR